MLVAGAWSCCPSSPSGWSGAADMFCVSSSRTYSAVSATTVSASCLARSGLSPRALTVMLGVSSSTLAVTRPARLLGLVSSPSSSMTRSATGWELK